MRCENSNRNIRAAYPLATLCLLLITACTTTEKVPLSEDTVNCGLLGNSCGMKLTPAGKGQAGLRYVNPAAQWSSYNKVMIDPVTGEVLAEAVDKRIGGGSFTTGFQWQWGDAENAINKWCGMTTERLSA